MVQQRGTSKLLDGTVIKNLNRWLCTSCRAEFFDPAAMRAIREQRKKALSRVRGHDS